MTEQEQIEEMAKEIEKAKQHIWASVMAQAEDFWASVKAQAEDEDYLWHSRAIAEHLTSQGYQKIDEFAECRNCTAWSGTDCTRHPYTQGCLKEENNIKQQAVKEFAEKLWNKIKDNGIDYRIGLRALGEEIDELLKEYEK